MAVQLGAVCQKNRRQLSQLIVIYGLVKLARLLLNLNQMPANGVLKMEVQEKQVALPLMPHTILGACEAIGQDFGFNPIFLRVPFAASVLWNPEIAIGSYLALAIVVLVSRLVFPVREERLETRVSAANEGHSLAKAA
jgi:phage shock protein PspC (stress-responsive transcriptional regulator)